MKYLITFILMTIALQFASAQQELSLADAINTAMGENFNIVISESEAEQARLNNTAGTAGLLPSVNATATGGIRYDDNNFQGEYTTANVMPGVQLNYRVFNGLAAWINKDRLELLENISEGNAELVIENTIQAVVLAYNQVLVEKERLQVFAEVLDLSRDRFEYELNRKELGLSVTFDVLQARNAYLSDSSTYMLQALNYKNAIRNLNLLMNKPLENRPVLTDSLSLPTRDVVKENILRSVLDDNVSLRMQMLNRTLAAKQVELQKSALFPTIDLRAGTDYGWSRVEFEGAPARSGNTFDYYANFTLSFTLFNGGNLRRAIRDAEIDQEIAGLETASLELNLRNQVLALFDLYNVQAGQLDLARQNLEAAELNLQIAGEKFRNGSINSFNFRDIQLVYLNAALSYIATKYDLVGSYTELMRLSGRIIPQG